MLLMYFHRVLVGVTQCTKRSRFLALDIDNFTDNFDQAFGDFVPLTRCHPEDDFFLHVLVNGRLEIDFLSVRHQKKASFSSTN